MIQENVMGVFVYGTLKRGQCRERCWRIDPKSVIAAWTRGSLHTRSDYPALVAGDDKVLGELWFYDAKELAQVLKVLDEVEQTNQPGLDDLYHRVVVDAFTLAGDPLGSVFTYHYAMNLLADGFKKIEPRGREYVQWPE